MLNSIWSAERPWRRHARILVALGALTLAACLLAACGGGGSSSSSSSESTSSGSEESEAGGSGEVSVDVGNGKTVTLPTNPKPKVGLFAGSGTTWAQKMVDETKKRAAEAGFEVEWVDSKFEPKLQLEQLTNALTNKQFGVWILQAADGNIMCKIASEQAPDANVLVIVQSLPLCGQDYEKDIKTWTPGTAAMVGQADQSVTYKVAWLERMMERPWWNEVKEIGVLQGPPLYGSTVSVEKAIAQVPAVKEKIVAESNTDFTAPDALAKTQDMLQAHPNINVLMSIYSDETPGIVQAVKEAGKQDQIKIVDIGASTQVVELIKNKEVDFSIPYTPDAVAMATVNALTEAFEGKTPKRWTDQLPLVDKGTETEPLVIEEKVAEEFEPEY
jgi:ribose transport system substrate-binding protein